MSTVPHAIPSSARRLLTGLLLAVVTLTTGVPLASAQTATRTATPVPTATATPTPKLVRVQVSPRAVERKVGQFQSFAAFGIFSDGSSKNYTQKVIYFSSNLAVAFPPNEEGNAGRVEAVGVGTATISAVEPGTSISSEASGESAIMTVVEAPTPTPTRTGPTPTRTFTPIPTATATPILQQLLITPLVAKRKVGEDQNFSVHAIFSDGSDKNVTQLATYSSSNTNVVQTPNDTTTNKGRTVAVGPGVAMIKAVWNGVSTTNTGGDAEFTVTISPTPTVTRTGSTPTPTLSPSPTPSATPVIVSLKLTPETSSKGLGTSQTYVATATLSNGSTQNITQRCTYTSSNPSVAQTGTDPNSKSKVLAVGAGTATISAVDTVTNIGTAASGGNATLDVFLAPTPTPKSTSVTPTRTKTPTPTATATPILQQLQITPLTAKRKVGEDQNFSVKAIFSDGSEKNVTQLATYSSSNTSVVQTPNDTTANKGRTVAVGPGVAMISAVWNGISTTNTGGDAEFTVTISPTPTVTRTGPTPTPTLSPSPTPTATPVIVSLALTPPTARRGLGTTQTYVATATLSDGTTKNITQRCTYTSSNPNVAQTGTDPNSKSKVLAAGVGTATISAVDTETLIGTAASGGSATLDVFLAATPTPKSTSLTPTRTKTPTPTATATPQLVSLAISPTNVKKAAGQFQTFTVTGTYSNGDEKSMTQKVDYISSHPNIVETGVDTASKSKVLAKAPGTAVITAKDPVTNITIPLDEGVTFLVTEGPTPTPTRTGPTSTGPTGTPTLSPTPTPSPTPVITKLTLKPNKAQKPVGTPQFFTAMGLFSDGVERNVSQKVTYASSDPSVASAPNVDGDHARILTLKVGKATISVTDPSTGVTSSTSGGDAELTVVEGSGSPNPRGTATPSPEQVGNATTACQRDVRRAARTFLDKKMKTLEKCGSGASNCVQRKPTDPGCLPGVRTRCATALGKIAAEETKLIAAVIRKCAGLSANDVLGEDGLAYGGIANSCLVRFGRTLTDLTSVAQCLTAQHACRAETLFALERPRAGELLRLVEAAPDAGSCREDFGGSGAGVGDPKGLGKVLEGCVKALVHGGTSLARTRLASIGRCIDGVFLCVEAVPGNAACLAKATQKCEREFGKVQREVGKLGVTAGKRCNGIDFALLSSAEGAYLDAVSSRCPSYGIPNVTSFADYVACLVRQHECEVAELVRFESPRAADILELVGRTLVDGTCPTP